MSNLFALVQNENMKIYLRPRTWVMGGIILLLSLVVATMLATIGDGYSGDMYSFMSLSKNFSMLVFIFTVVVTAEIVAGEFSWGTIKLLLIRPATRSKILLSKYIASLLFLLAMAVFNLVVSALVGLLFFGIDSASQGITFGSLLQDYGFALIDLFINLTIAFMISSVFRSSVFAIALSMILYFLSATVMAILTSLKYGWAKYLLYANTDLTQYREGGKPMFEGMTLSFSITMLVVYYIVLVALAWTVFNKRDVAG